MDWKVKLDKFLAEFEHMPDVVGVLVCGSYITGSPTSHSDLDVHIILEDGVEYRERGNKIIDGLLIEYFANPTRQILQYMKTDLEDKSLMSQVQFATGEIIFDRLGAVADLQQKAKAEIAGFYKAASADGMGEYTKYFLWDRLDDLLDAYETNRADFDFIYFNVLNATIADYMNAIGRPYNCKAIFGNINDAATRRKYLLQQLPDEKISITITAAITAQGRGGKVEAFQRLTAAILEGFGGFSIDGFKLKTPVTASD